MTAPFSAPDKHPLSGQPPHAELYNRPTLIAAIAASVGVIVGSLAPWANAFVFSLSGLDAGYLGKATLTLGALSGVLLLIELARARTPFNPRWAVPVAWAVAVAGVACLTIALPVVIRWGLWLLTVFSAVLCVTAAIVATQIAKNIELLQPPGQSTTVWANGWRWVAIMASAVIAIAGTAYFSYNWEDKSLGSGPSPSEPPSYPSFRSFPSLGTTPETTTEPPSPTRPAQLPGSPTRQLPPSPTGTSTPRVSLPGTDGQGWVGSYARCDPGNPPALMARTTGSLVVVCQAGPGNYYYRGVRLSDGASIELPNAVRTSSGFDVTNPTDGTRYQLRPNVLNIIGPRGQVESESMVQYASS